VARATWKGVIGLGDVEVPVKLYSAVEDRGVHFRLLHEPDLVPVEQKMVHPGTNRPVPYEDTRRGVETPEGLVILDEEELAEIEPEPSREIRVHRFVPPAAIDPRWYLRPYWLGPDESAPDYAALAAAMEKAGREGVATWVMRDREYRGALRAREGRLMLVTLRSPSEVISAESLGVPGGRELAGPERGMALQLVEALSAEFNASEWRDEYRERVLELVEAKRSGKVVAFRPARTREPADSLEGALAASLKAAGKRRAHA
jgi:DNA end-binding protein Ku